MLDSTGTVVATYNYDAWGNCVVTTDTNGIGEINPIRYRGYYWDAEFGLYYLQSRYYSPTLCRFISQDSIEYLDPESINGLNLYAYCSNNPVMYGDSTGHDAIYVVNYRYGDGGIPVVGHAFVILIDNDGNWYITEFTGDKKPNAHVNFVDYQTKAGQEAFQTRYKKALYRAIFLEVFTGTNSIQYIRGDHTQSIIDAQNYQKNQDFGKYHFTENNCLDYVQTILKAGKYNNKIMHWYINNNNCIVPAEYFSNSQLLSTLYLPFRPIVQSITAIIEVSNEKKK